MRPLAISTLIVLTMLLAMGAMAANSCSQCGQPVVQCPRMTQTCPAAKPCANPGANGVCRKCAAPAWDRCPVVVYPYPTMGAGPAQPALVDPWANCGAFCAAGQIPSGWPGGWNSQYWMRPDSNF
jgi:hypothetical protein